VACAAAALLNFFGIAFLGVRVSHRIAGPVFAMVRYLRNLQNGQYGETMRIRESDELKYLARHIGDLGVILKDKTSKDLAHLDEIIAIMGKSQDSFSKEDRIRVMTNCEKLKSELSARIAKTESEQVDAK
jgi:signal transduction histidine kinase